MAKKNIRSLDLSKLKKISRRYVQLTHGLLERYPQLSEEAGFGQEWVSRLAAELQLPLQCRYVGMEETGREKFISGFSSPCIAVVLQSEPDGGELLVDVDNALAHLLVAKVLGAEENSGQDLTPFSAIETGVFEFLIAKALHQLQTSTNAFGPTRFRLQKIISDAKPLANAEAAEEMGCQFKFFLGLGKQGGYCRVYIPHPLAEGTLLQEDVVAGQTDEVLEQRLQRVSHIQAPLCSELGRVQLEAADKARLEIGDVILLDDTLATFGSHGLSGKTILRVGENSPHGLLAEIIDSENKLVVKVLDFYGGNP